VERPVGDYLHGLPPGDRRQPRGEVEYNENGGDAVAKVAITP
jgi:hypothetical protein